MTQAELYANLKTIGLPTTYRKFNHDVAPPYMVYLFSHSADFIADNQNYVEISEFQIELYTTHKDLALEKQLQDLFKNLNLVYTKIETYIDAEELLQVIYTVSIS